MSQITECTLVVKLDQVEKVWSDFKEFEDPHRLSDFKLNYKNEIEDIAIFIFDCNGDNPWASYECEAEYLLAETNYLDGDEPWTTGPESDYEQLMVEEWLSKKLSPDDFKEAVSKIAYTC